MASVLKRWNGSSWVVVSSVTHMINGSIFSPGIYGMVGEPLVVEQNFGASSINTSVISLTITTELIDDIASDPSTDLSMPSVSNLMNAPTITVQII